MWVKIAEQNLQVGDIVRTTFTASPAVLTTALFGVNGEYSASVSYGYNWSEDTANALHCDMPKGVGTFSTWLSDGGQNFKNLPWATNSQLYMLQSTCSTDADCSNTTLQCGPGYTITGKNILPDNSTQSGPRTAWNPNATLNPAASQCPGNSYCSLCGSPNTASTSNYCKGIDADAIGTCINTNQGKTFTFSCTQPFNSVSEKYCAVALPVSTVTPKINRLTSCTSLSDYANTFYTYTSNSIQYYGTCGFPNTYVPAGSTPPFFCQYQGNPMCLPGQQCVSNWSSLTGWSVPGNPNPNLTPAANVCSGTVYPNVAIKSQWIAEGTVTAISQNGTFANVQWNRVANTYPGIGPSANWCNGGLGNCSATSVADNFSDLTWLYSDCRFVLGDNSPTNSRHWSVSQALLGSSVSNPRGLGIFSVSDVSFSSYNLQSLLYVNPTNSGTVTNNWSNTVGVPFRRTAWNLQSVAVPKANLEKIFFYSIHPMQTSAQTEQWHLTNYS